MSSGQTPRTPVYFPRMKVRGKRRRARQSRVRVAAGDTLLPSVIIGFDGADPDSGVLSYTVRPVPPGTPGAQAMLIRPSKPSSGGRVVSSVASSVGVRSTTINFTTPEINADLLDLIFGRAATQRVVN